MPFGIGQAAWNPQTSVSPGHDIAVDSPGSIHIQTPSEHADSPGNVGPPFNAPSPLSAALAIRASTIRTEMFLQGRFAELISSMNNNEKRLVLLLPVRLTDTDVLT